MREIEERQAWIEGERRETQAWMEGDKGGRIEGRRDKA